MKTNPSTQNPKVTFTPLGGLQQIGANMSLWEDDTTGIIVDCGIMFPGEDGFGVDYLICDFKNLDKEKFQHLILTHAHEDHIGAVNHLLEFHPGLTVWCNDLVKKFLKKKFPQFFANGSSISFKSLDERVGVALGSFHLIPFEVPHSVPSSFNFLLEHDQLPYVWLHSTDFKVSSNSTQGDWKEAPYPFDWIKSRIPKDKKLVALVDSTNALVSGTTPSEQALKPGLQKILETPGRIFITLFSSNLIRLKNIISLGITTERRLIPVGRAVWNAIHIAQEAKFLAPELPLYDEESMSDLEIRDPRNLFIVSGCQGEIRSAVNRVASGQDGKLKLNPQDRFVFSSKTIPGNEHRISYIYNKITESGASIVTAHDEFIHASGHPAQEDLKIYFETLKPDHMIPIHGETWFLKRMTEFASKINSETKTHFMINGQSLNFYAERTEGDIGIHYGLPPIAYHGRRMPISRAQINVRRRLAELGVIMCSWSRRQLQLSYLGLPELLADTKMQKEKEIHQWILQEASSNKDDPASLNEKLRVKIRQSFELTLGYRPIVDVHFHE
jgi:ribonuclease J